jgi:hypothetical protein
VKGVKLVLRFDDLALIGCGPYCPPQPASSPKCHIEDLHRRALLRNKLLGHAYLLSITSVDTQAAFLREKLSTGHIAKLRSVSTKRAPGLLRTLRTKEMANLLNDLTATKLYGGGRLTRLRPISVLYFHYLEPRLNPSETPLHGPAVL